MNIQDLLFYRKQLEAQMPGGDATLGSTGSFAPRGMPAPQAPQSIALSAMKNLPSAGPAAVTDPASLPFFAGGDARPNMPQFADPRVQAMLPPLPGPARNVGPAPGASPAQGPLPMQGPPMPPAWGVRGYSKGLADAGPGAQAYADQFAGGDLSKIRSRLINIDGEMKNDYYTQGLLDGPMPTGSAAPDASSSAPNPQSLDWLQRLFGGMFGGGA